MRTPPPRSTVWRCCLAAPADCSVCAAPLPRGAICVEIEEDELRAVVCGACARDSGDAAVKGAAT
jgi:hypothetical protein